MPMATEHQTTTGKENQIEQQPLPPPRTNSNHELWHDGKSINTPTYNRISSSDNSNSNNIPRQSPPLRLRNVTKSKTLTKQTPVVESVDSVIDNQEEVGVREAQRTEWHLEYPKSFESHKHIQEREDQNNIDYGRTSFEEIYNTPPDYRIYQEGEVNQFFNGHLTADDHHIPKTISEICLVNDHYILVKMPSQMDIQQSLNQDIISQRIPTPVEEKRGKSKLCHYLRRRHHRIRKIAPINEEPESPTEAKSSRENQKSSRSIHCLNVNSCWQSKEDEVEVYETRTIIHKSAPQSIRMETWNRSQEKSSQKSSNKSCQTSVAPDNNSPLHACRSNEIQSISGNILKSSLRESVALHHSGSLIVGDPNDPKQWNLNYLRKNATSRRRNRFQWLLRPFRSRYRKSMPNNPKIQAVVYKSYFVKWTKPPETLHHGYGYVRTSSYADAPALRRCRSALF
ncbi:uncharacterized protein LOC142226423 [Haematobia irritans]|uniref:uncharacterized protein LOC142226423 n=1 Tax=Haematobia irritans TaxID=7368 RepID=UPI003F5046DC